MSGRGLGGTSTTKLTLLKAVNLVQGTYGTMIEYNRTLQFYRVGEYCKYGIGFGPEKTRILMRK